MDYCYLQNMLCDKMNSNTGKKIQQKSIKYMESNDMIKEKVISLKIFKSKTRNLALKSFQRKWTPFIYPYNNKKK